MRERNGWEWLRIVTPILVTISLFLLSQIYIQVNLIGQRLYEHQTNAELHVTRSEFATIQNQIASMRDEVVRTIRELHQSTGGAP